MKNWSDDPHKSADQQVTVNDYRLDVRSYPEQKARSSSGVHTAERQTDADTLSSWTETQWWAEILSGRGRQERMERMDRESLRYEASASLYWWPLPLHDGAHRTSCFHSGSNTDHVLQWLIDCLKTNQKVVRNVAVILRSVATWVWSNHQFQPSTFWQLMQINFSCFFFFVFTTAMVFIPWNLSTRNVKEEAAMTAAEEEQAGVFMGEDQWWWKRSAPVLVSESLWFV